jgi:hypothetical protein
VNRGRHRNLAPISPLWQGRERQEQACDSIVLPFAYRALSLILGTWLDHFSEDFCETHFPCLKLLLNYLVIYMPGPEDEG